MSTLRIPLTQGKFAIIDEEDADLVVPHRWYAQPHRRTIYVKRSKTSGNHTKWVYLHREIMGNPPGVQVDHRNGDGLDNRRSNLRLATNTQNHGNMRLRKTSRTGFKGVRKLRTCFSASIFVDGKTVRLGTFSSVEEAANAYDDAAREAWGEFACLNFPRDGERSAA